MILKGNVKMNRLLMLLFLTLVCASEAFAQTSGNITYSTQGNNRKPREAPSGNISVDEKGIFVEANILMNVKADEYVAVFGVVQEGRTIQEGKSKLDAQLNDFTGELKKLSIKSDDIEVDFIAQNRIYDYEVTGDTAREKLTGFEIKKNVIIHYKEKTKLEELLLAAAKASIFDLIKVDYVVSNVGGIREKLLEEGARIVREKAARYGKLFGLKFRSQIQIYTEKYGAHYPTELYDSYTAFESGNVRPNYYNNQRYQVVEARKSKNSFFNAQDGGDFDYVINPVVIEPVVQFTLYLRVRHEIDR